MASAVWLFVALPIWYFSTIFAPFGAGVLTAIPALGVLCLAVGVVLAILSRETGLWLFLLLPAASQLLVAVAGLMRGSLPHSASHPILFIFFLLQIALAGYLVWRLTGARRPATMLAAFSSSYAFFAAFVALMAFSDDWL